MTSPVYRLQWNLVHNHYQPGMKALPYMKPCTSDVLWCSGRQQFKVQYISSDDRPPTGPSRPQEIPLHQAQCVTAMQHLIVVSMIYI